MKTNFKLSLIACCTIAVTAWLIWPTNRIPAKSIGPGDLNQTVDEIMAVGEFYLNPEPNHSETKVAYMRQGHGKRVAIIRNLADGTEKIIPLPSNVIKIYSWSPDDRYLLLSDFDGSTRFRIYDTETEILRQGRIGAPMEIDRAQWIATNAYVYISKSGENAQIHLTEIVDDHRVGELSKHLSGTKAIRALPIVRAPTNQTNILAFRDRVVRKFPNPGTKDWLAVINDSFSDEGTDSKDHWKIAYIEENELCTFDLQNDTFAEITTNLAQGYGWLCFNRETGRFLFCSEDDSDWRHLYCFDSRANGTNYVTQLTVGPDHSYNGQWIQSGNGFTYVGNITNHFYLAVRPSDPKLTTNLFSHIRGYRVSHDGGKIYATASLGSEPESIWEYDIKRRKLKEVVPGHKPFTFAKIIPRTSHWLKSEDGLEIPYYSLAPRELDTNKIYPAVIAVPPEMGQFVQAWDKYSQLLANIGVWQFAVNPRGSEGYGNKYRRMRDGDAYLDILATYAEVMKNPNVDKKRIFLMTWSNGSGAVNTCVELHPDYWNGIILLAGFPPRTRNTSMPRYLLFVGEKDPAKVGVREFKSWADKNGVAVRTVFGTNTFHSWISSTDVDFSVGSALANFVFDSI